MADKPKKKTSITAEDYGYLSQLVMADLKKMKIGGRGYKEANDLYQLLREKAKKARESKASGSGIKAFAKWLCLNCNAVHEKVETKQLCIDCGSEEVKKQKEPA